MINLYLVTGNGRPLAGLLKYMITNMKED